MSDKTNLKNAAKDKLVAELKRKYERKIVRKKERMQKERKWVDNFIGKTVRHQGDLSGKVEIKIDHKTSMFVDKEKCELDADGNWVKKERKIIM